MSGRLSWQRVTSDSTWDSFVSASPQGNIFAKSYFHNALTKKPGRFLIYNKNELRAGAFFSESIDGKDAVLNDLIIYSGLLFGAPTSNQNLAQRQSEQFRIGQFVAENLPREYNKARFALHPEIIDVRPFLWFNYHGKESRYKIDIRYTNYLTPEMGMGIKELQEHLLGGMSASRRQEIRYSERDRVSVEESINVDKLVGIYEQALGRQGKRIDDQKRIEMLQVMNAILSRGDGTMFIARNSEGKVGSMAFFGWDSLRVYYLFGATNPGNRDQHTGTRVIWEAITKFYSHGFQEIDLEGVNSPNRGWFKSSFGGRLVPYYEVRWKA